MRKYEAEHKELVLTKGNKPRVYKGGRLSKLSDGVYQINGNTHEEGGVIMSGGDFILSDQDHLGNGVESPADIVRKNPDNKMLIENVAQTQEAMKGNSINTIFKNGGRLKKYNLGGISPLNLQEPVLTANPMDLEYDPILNTFGSDPFHIKDIMTYRDNTPPTVTGTFNENTKPKIPLRTEYGSTPTPANTDEGANISIYKNFRTTDDADLVGNLQPISDEEISMLDAETMKDYRRNARQDNPSFSSPALENLMDKDYLLDNIYNEYLTNKAARARIPKQSILDPLKTPDINLRAEKVEAARQAALAQKYGSDFASSQAQAASKNAIKGMLTSKTSEIAGKENTINYQKDVQDLMRQEQVNQARANAQFQDLMTEFGRADDIRRERSANMANLAEDLKGRRTEKYMNKNMKRQMVADLLKASPSNLEYILNNMDSETIDKIINNTSR